MTHSTSARERSSIADVTPPLTVCEAFQRTAAIDPDAIALKSAISILQLQARNATADIRALQRIKERAVADPEAFARALASGEVASKPDPLVAPPPGLAPEHCRLPRAKKKKRVFRNQGAQKSGCPVLLSRSLRKRAGDGMLASSS